VRIWVAAQQFDFGFATPAGEIEGLISEPFLAGRGVCVLPPGHPLARRKVIRPADLQGAPFVSLALEDPARRKIDSVFEQAGVERNIVVETQYAMTICGLVQRGVGCTILNPVTALDHVPLGLVLKPFEPVVMFEYMLYRPAHRPLSLVARRFIELLCAQRDKLARKGFVQPMPQPSMA
jgi:DNA-binding transcriptional LysR family regulator